MSKQSAEITMLLSSWGEGDTSARDELLSVVYTELRQLARHYMRGERGDHTLEPTAVVHEAFLRLTAGTDVNWTDRSHFFRLAARAMRRVLVDHGRGNRAAKRGHGLKNQLLEEQVVIPGIDIDILALDEALKKLGKLDERLAQVVELRFFAGFKVEEIGSNLGVSSRTVKRDWRSARAWLLAELGPSGGALERSDHLGAKS